MVSLGLEGSGSGPPFVRWVRGSAPFGIGNQSGRHSVGKRNGSRKGVTVVVPENADLRREVLKLTHDHPTAGHPGAKKMLLLTTKNYWWPRMADFISQYVKGCGVCQATKPALVWPKPPLYPITTESSALPFSTIALDLIVDLPPSQGYDSILTITDHDVTKAALFFPCHQTITGEGVAAIYAQHVFPHYGLPQKVISDRDTRFTSKFIKELESILDITPNMSMAYYSQTDGQSE